MSLLKDVFAETAFKKDDNSLRATGKEYQQVLMQSASQKAMSQAHLWISLPLSIGLALGLTSFESSQAPQEEITSLEHWLHSLLLAELLEASQRARKQGNLDDVRDLRSHFDSCILF